MRPTLSLLTAKKPLGAAAYPRKSVGPTPAAFALVREVLKDRPHHFRELLAQGVEARLPEASAPEAESSSAAQQKAAAGKKLNTNPFKAIVVGKNKVGGALQEIDVPEGHPFVSGNFLKNRIIPTLRGLNLVQRTWVAPFPGTALAKHAPDRKHVMWSLTAADDRTTARWSELTAPGFSHHDLPRVGREVRAEKDADAHAAREARIAAGEERRTAREIMNWADRPKGFTVTLERTHLNRRRARARDAKEARAAGLAADMRAVLAEAKAVEQVQG